MKLLYNDIKVFEFFFWSYKVLSQLNQETNNKSKYGNCSQIKNIPKNISFKEYISYIKQKFKENPLEYESIDMTNNKKHYKFSICFKCHNPVIACEDKVICVNRCFKFNVKTNIFNDDYTLDNFNEQYNEFCKEHILCLRDVKLIYINPEAKKAFFICEIFATKKLLIKRELFYSFFYLKIF